MASGLTHVSDSGGPSESDLEVDSDPCSARLASAHRRELLLGERFAFGENWRSFLRQLDESRIREAEGSLQRGFERTDLRGCTFLDVGSGSGLFSLAAARLGAERIVSFDYDAACVECGRALKQRYFPQADRWVLAQGDARCPDFMNSLGRFDLVYSWGVLHQTGAMWQSLDNISTNVAVGGRLMISIYNHQPGWTPLWTAVKRFYNRTWSPVRWGLVAGYLGVKVPLLWFRGRWSVEDDPRSRRARRGMSTYHDAVDWIGGYPFETAAPERVFRFFRDRGYVLRDFSTVGGGSGCNEFVFLRPEDADEDTSPD